MTNLYGRFWTNLYGRFCWFLSTMKGWRWEGSLRLSCVGWCIFPLVDSCSFLAGKYTLHRRWAHGKLLVKPGVGGKWQWEKI